MIRLRSDAKDVIRDNKGETIVEVVVAFLVLSIMLALFAQGLSYAGKTSSYAVEEMTAADTAVIELQKTINYTGAEGTEDGKALRTSEADREYVFDNGSSIVAHQYVVSQASGTDIRNYYYWVYEVKNYG